MTPEEKAKAGLVGIKRRRRRRPYPIGYRTALAKHLTRAHRRETLNPGVRLTREGEGYDSKVSYGPYFQGDDDFWWLQLANAFGTRSDSVISAFIDELIQLAGDRGPTERLVNAAIATISAYQPRNEGEAMLAAQMVAVNALTMKAASYANGHGSTYIAEKEAKLAFRGARTFAEQTDVMARLKGRQRTQRIEVHYYDERQIIDGDVHVHRGESESNRPTRRAYGGDDGKSAGVVPAVAHASGPAMLGQDPQREPMPRPRREGPPPLSPAWLWSWIRGTAR